MRLTARIKHMERRRGPTAPWREWLPVLRCLTAPLDDQAQAEVAPTLRRIEDGRQITHRDFAAAVLARLRQKHRDS